MFGNLIKGIKGEKDKEKDGSKERDRAKTSSTPLSPNSQSSGGAKPTSPSLVPAGITEEDLAQQFAHLLEELGVPDAKKVEMMSMSNDKKWILLMGQKDKIRDTEEKAKQNGSLYDTPQYFLSVLRENAATHKLISELRVCLGSNPMSWINSFLQLGGFGEILKIFQAYQLKQEKDKSDFAIMSDCVLCIKSLLNSQVGLKSVMATSHTFKLLILCLDLSYPADLRSAILSLTGALALVPQIGHPFVIEALENFRQSSREKSRFWTIVEGARQVAKTQLQYEYWTSFMTFVNSVVNSPPDLQTRVTLRSEFTALELIELVNPSRGKHQELDVQIDVFFECQDEDNQEMGSAYTDVNIQSPSEVSSKLHTLLQPSPALHHHFMSILRCLYTLASTQPDLGGKQWNLLDEAVGTLLSDPTRESQASRIDSLSEENRKLSEQVSKLKSAAATAAIAAAQVSAATPATMPPPTTPPTVRQEVDITPYTNQISSLNSTLEESRSEIIHLSSTIKTLEKNIKDLDAQLAKSKDLSSQLTAKNSELQQQQQQRPASTEASPSVDQPSVDIPDAPMSGGPPPPPPPPPPPGGAGGPPPPPPPPPGGAGGPPPPPPPPGSKKAGAPAAPAGPVLPTRKTPPVPSVKMVGLQWKKVNNNSIESSVWMNVKEYNLNDQFKTLEDLFAAKKPRAPAAPSAGGAPKSDNPLSPGKAAPAISILDIKRSQGISIMLSRFKMPLPELAKAINNFDETKLSLEDAKSLSKFCPTPEEIDILKEEDISMLGKPEQFLYEMSKVSRLSEKLDCFIFKQKMASQIEEIQPDADALLRSSQVLRENRRLQQLLEIILSLGNFINGGTPRGDVYGFKLDSLLSLGDVRSPTDSKLTLLTWLIQFLEQKHPDLLNVHEDIAVVDEGKRVSVQNLKSELGGLRKGINQVKQEVELAEGVSKNVLNNFLSQAQDQVTALEKKVNQACESFTAAVQHYGEDTKTATPEEFFATVGRFRAEFKRCYEQLLKDRENATKMAARKLNAPSPQSQKPAVPAGAKPQLKQTMPIPMPNINVHAISDDDDDNQPHGQFMDSLMSSMKGGQAIRIARRASQYVGSPTKLNQMGPSGLEALNAALKNKVANKE
ncbi:hypothetical protein SAMD00019534_027000 [Acytostelium subglobosum LB1]|uniref:hypothetical protein n=1 Tax=Acytostelium subglobosum LB1 TaxID=1410327 RepID=UPI000644B32B|nr:hypothetical protein SAMD00019534_027000 [Acytostelium subglobosum LB1]GAM19525.1 hypothetical protein SAMD00019534_027000 [Acytostelium subglobosum LB1]|eukprot:XP_012757452.1 hypothetical protein SAMD00019534_027000 [Acytostelium subglobosum LB1]